MKMEVVHTTIFALKQVTCGRGGNRASFEIAQASDHSFAGHFPLSNVPERLGPSRLAGRTEGCRTTIQNGLLLTTPRGACGSKLKSHGIEPEASHGIPAGSGVVTGNRK